LASQVRGAGLKLPITISEDLLTDILKPYRPNARYLKLAEITHFRDSDQVEKGAKDVPLAVGVGRFAIPESCYIDDTGHFNAVEFNICYNQLAYVVFAKGVEAGLVHQVRREEVDAPSLTEYKRHQLPAMLIVGIEGVRFFKQLKSSDFGGELTISKASSVGGAWFFSTSITFSDHEGVKAKGSVMLAYSPTFNPVKH